MQFRFKTMRKTRQSYNAQQIYWEIVKLKKYFKLNTLFGEPKTPPILFHRVQLPYRFKTIDMEQLGIQFINIPQLRINRNHPEDSIGQALGHLVLLYYLAQLLHDDQFRYFAFVRYPEYMRQFELLQEYLNRKQLEMIERLHLQGKELKGRVGYHNIKSGIMSLFEREKQELDLVKADNSLTNLEEFLQEQDEKVIK